MEPNVKVIMDATGCTETEAQSVLQEAGGDVSRALKLLDAVSKEIMVVQAEFNVAGREEGTGFLTAMFDMASSNVVHADLAFPLGPDKARMLDVGMPPTVFASTIKSVRTGLSDRNQASCRSNCAQIKAKFSAAFIQAVTAMAGRGQMDVVNERLAKTIGGVLGEEVKVKTRAAAHSLSSVSSVLGGNGHSALSPEQKAAELFGAPDRKEPELQDLDNLPSASPQEELPRIMLMCEPEISPFEGRPARELVEGDEVIVKIKDGRESARYFAELLGGLVNDELVPLCAPVIKANKMSDTFVEAYVEFGPGIFGQFFIPPDVKVKTFDSGVELYDPFQNEESLFSDKRMGRKIVAELGLLIVSTLVLIAVFLSLGW